MVVLDTNVLSALMRPSLNSQVVAWLDARPPESIWTAAVCVFEVRHGLERLPVGRRRAGLEEAFDAMLGEDMGGRVLPFDATAADEAGRLGAELEARGRTVDMRDVLIAGTVRARNATLATRNVSHFEHAGVQVVNPWDAP